MTKICCDCKQEKQIEEFPKHKNGKVVKIRDRCRLCYNKYHNEYNRKNRDKHQKRVKRVEKKNKDYIRDKKISQGCLICGYKKCARSLHYHHINPDKKLFNISLTYKIGKEKREEELAKCVLLCSNCHGEVEEGITKIFP